MGPYSNNLVKEWTKQVMGTPMDPCSESSCEFHILQHVGAAADKKFPTGQKFDDTLRFVQARYGFGARKLLVRSVAAHFGRRCFSIRAPRTDNFKVTFYSRGVHRRFLRDYDVFRMLVAVDLEICYANLRRDALRKYEAEVAAFNAGLSARKRPPKMPSSTVGVRTKDCRELRQVGRTLLDPKVLVFGIGKGDLRNVFLAAYATLTQNFKISALVKVACQSDMFSAMRSAISGLARLAGMLRMLAVIVWDRNVCRARWSLGRESLRLHVSTFSVHCCWRYIPNVLRLLPGLLLQYEFQGASIRESSNRFSDPPPKKNKAFFCGQARELSKAAYS